MDTKKLEKWANQLLDTGKRNNLINFKDVKASTVEVVMPTSAEIFDKVDSSASFEVYDPKIVDYEDDLDVIVPNEVSERLSREEYISMYSSKIKKHNQISSL